ncbi:MAG: DUF58 domain-containing protein [Propionibacteriaceae bacterium]|jgi:uncharacterized protein (DUF58 family)|nr:DUF58 domain-containing protein [Propionibacteriaceae bacterium]
MKRYRRPTLRGVLLLLAGLAGVGIGVVFALPVPVLLGAAVLAAVIADFAALAHHTRHWNSNLPIEPVFAPNPAMAGQTVTLNHHLGAHPEIAADLTQELPAELEPSAADLGYAFRARRRGRYPLRKVLADKLAVFGCGRAHAEFPTPAQLVVWPEIMFLEFHTSRGTGLEDEGQAGVPVPKSDDITLREYRAGDALHRVHWRSTARRGELMSRAEEPARELNARVELRFGQDATAAEVELAVSLVGSLVYTLGESGYQVALGKGADWAVDGWRQLLDRLAVLAPEAPLPAAHGQPPALGLAVTVACGAGVGDAELSAELSADRLTVLVGGPENPPAGWVAVSAHATLAEAGAALAAALAESGVGR